MISCFIISGMPREITKCCDRWIYVISQCSGKKISPLHYSLTKSKLIKTILPRIYYFYKGKNDIYPGKKITLEKSAFGSWNCGILISRLVGDDSDSLQLSFDSTTFVLFFELPRFRSPYLFWILVVVYYRFKYVFKSYCSCLDISHPAELWYQSIVNHNRKNKVKGSE